METWAKTCGPLVVLFDPYPFGWNTFLLAMVLLERVFVLPSPGTGLTLAGGGGWVGGWVGGWDGFRVGLGFNILSIVFNIFSITRFWFGLGLRWVPGWLRVGSRWVPNLLRANVGVAMLVADCLVLVYGGASWGWSRVGLGLVSDGFKIGCSHGCV